MAWHNIYVIMKAMCPGYITIKILEALEKSCPSKKLPQSYCADNREEGRFVFMITHTQIYHYYLLLLFISLVILLTVQFIFQLLCHGNYYLYYCYYYYFYLNLLS